MHRLEAGVNSCAWPAGTAHLECAFSVAIRFPTGATVPLTYTAIMPIVLLIASNVFMTIAWYGHLKFPQAAMWVAVMVSWGIALLEYWLAVPANRIGRAVYDPAELKAMQEVITLAVFAVFSVAYLGERLTLNHGVGFGFIALGAWFVFKGPL
jgi:uncharacterized protein (DUF486 family)